MSGKVIEGDRPSAHGARLGTVLALLADLGERDSPVPLGDRCLTCAFREGSVANQSAATALTAFRCSLSIDKDRFACHHGMKNGEPQRICVGYLASLLAPFSIAKEAVLAFHSDLQTLPEADPIREAFDAWLTEIDPDGKMDVYQVGRAWACRKAAA